MKFSHSLKFNSVPEWREYYINYAAFKKIIYAIEQAERRLDSLDTLRRVSADGVAEPLLEAQPAPAEGESRFVKLLDAELTRIVSFYLHKESDLRARLEALKLQVRSVEAGRHERQASTASRESGRSSGMGASSSSEVARQVVWDSPALAGERQQWSAEVKSLYVEANDLAAYIDMNYDGFRKVLKKHDKVTGFSLKQRFMETVNDMFTFRDKAIVNSIIARSLDMYAAIACAGDTRRAKTDLQGHLRDHAKWERETVWRDMVGLERQRTTARVVREGAKQQLPAGTMQLLSVAVSLLAFLGLLSTPTFAEPEKRNCLALLVLVSLLWCTEALPLYTTAILVPALVVILRVLTGTSPQHPQQHRLTPGEAAKAIFAAMMSQVIMLLLGGFAIAAALTKHFIAKQVAMSVLSRCGRKPRNVLLGCMAVATLASMWISNVAAPVLCFSLVQPILRTLPSNSPFCRSLVMAIALASNIGGMTSPISSPQNIFAIERMSMAGEPPNWLRWFAVALPVATAGLMLCWGLLLLVYQPGRAVAEIRPLRPSDDAFNATQLWVCLVSVVTVALWCANSVLEHITGSMGVLAVLPMVLFFGTGVLNKDDFNGFLWNVVVLAMGGCALGEAVTSSGLLKAIAEGIQGIVGGWGLFSVLAVFCAVVCVLTSFISHTVGAMVILPIVQEVGKQLPGGSHANLLVFGAALMCSGAMALPVSGFPNMTAVSLEDPTGKTYVSTVDFLKLGVPGSIGTYVIILTLGYALMLLCGF